MKCLLIQILFLSAVFSVGSSSITLNAQVKSVEIRGRVVDLAESVPISKAHVWIHEQGGGFYQEVSVDREGKFSVQLPEGYYYVLIGSSGFAPETHSLWLHDRKPIVLEVHLHSDFGNLQDANAIQK